MTDKIILSVCLDKKNIFELITAGYHFTDKRKMTDKPDLRVEND